jgi:signal transduction histidine kinase/BarA-like signal transduction histidine kinase
MHKKVLRHIALWTFLIGVTCIVFIQFISHRSINRLIAGNQSLLHELQIQNDLRRVESDVLTVESDIRGAVISPNLLILSDVKRKIANINHELVNVEQYFASSQNATEVTLLKKLIKEKLDFSTEILNAYTARGKLAGEEVINTGRGKVLRDSIVQVITSLDAMRHKKLAGITNTIEDSGSDARIWGVVLGVIACLFLITAFFYMLNYTSQQQKMIVSLNESEKRIKEAAHLKEQFLANMSHEIRTPMNAIIGFTSILKRTELKPDQRQFVQNIHSASDNLLALINDILDLSKIEAGMIQLEDTNFSFRSLAGSVASMFSEKIKEKDIELKTEIDEAIPDILTGDAVRLTQILVNLLGNAIKFTEKGEVRMSASLVTADRQKARLLIKVSDTGIGIPKEKQVAIFERFQQAEAETTRRFGGTGLGLSIVRQLIELQGGKLELESEPGKGSVFFFTIEYEVPDEEALLNQALEAETKTIPITEVKVLVAEDNMMNQALIRHLMKNWNINYTLVNNGAGAVAALQKEHYNMVLMDIQMPEMDGYTATSVIRNELKSAIPIVAMTAHAMMGEKEKCLQLGMNDYISKPLKETILYNIIAQYSYFTAET